MTLPSSGAISLNAIHVEAGGATGTTASINDSDIRALIGKASGATMSFSEWYGASSAVPISASGGTITTSGGYRYHKFTSSGTFSIASAASGSFSNTITVFICGGGGGASSYVGGGGGGARVRLLTFSASAGNKTVTVGSGGADGFGAYPTSAQGSTGGTSSVTGLSTATGGGGSYNRYHSSGTLQQHGGASGNGNAGGSDSYGADDGSSGGGGGYGAVGGNGTFSTAGNGGAGYTLSGFTASTSVTQYAGGGGGICFQSDGYKNGGSGVYGGANGSSGTSNAVANRGGGGGGSYVSTAGDGGSGIVIFKYEYS